MANIDIVHTETHDETKPAGSRARSLGDDDIREKDRAIRERLAIDHVALADEAGEAAIGIHKKVTMRVIADPTTYDDVGYVYLKMVSGVIELFYKDSAGNVTQITTGGKILGDNVQLTNDSYLKAKDAAGTGTVDLIKASAGDIPIIKVGAELSTSAAPTTDAGIANKKYVDDQVAAVPAQVGFGTLVDKTADYGAQQATLDGFVVAWAPAASGNFSLDGYTDSNANPTTLRARCRSNYTPFICMPVKKNDYWKIVLDGTTMGSAYFIPIGI